MTDLPSDKPVSQFAQHYMTASRLLMMALAEPTPELFEQAGRAAVRAIGSSFAGSTYDGSIEWNLAQSLARSINEARIAVGISAGPPRRPLRVAPSTSDGEVVVW